jgi:glucose-1-phosphate cytidylyltransferase
MKVVILAGGFGTRISEESHLVPKPMIEIGGKPILWHIMKYYSSYGFNEFIICAGYRQYVIKEFFSNYFLHTSDITFDFHSEKKVVVHQNQAEPWKVTVVDTGLNTMTGGRLKKIKKFINEDDFLLTYGDGLANVNLNNLIEFHKKSNAIVTLTAIQPEGRFGLIDINKQGQITQFKEKKKEDSGWINGGFMVADNMLFDFISDDNTVLEREPLENLAKLKKLSAFKHKGFWQCMDSMKDKNTLESLISQNQAEWMIWE